MVLMWTGNEFQAAGPATVNELSANRVLVRRTTKFPVVQLLLFNLSANDSKSNVALECVLCLRWLFLAAITTHQQSATDTVLTKHAICKGKLLLFKLMTLYLKVLFAVAVYR